MYSDLCWLLGSMEWGGGGGYQIPTAVPSGSGSDGHTVGTIHQVISMMMVCWLSSRCVSPMYMYMHLHMKNLHNVICTNMV